MGWPYHIISLTESQVQERRVLLDRYGVYAQLSALVPVIFYQLYRLAVWVSLVRRRSKDSVLPSSPDLKVRRGGTEGVLVRKWRATKWWLGGEVAEGWGSRGHWVAGGAWATWLLLLCVRETGEDYFHLTKRFGVIAASQLPLHYMLSMKSVYSPLALVFRASHEELNPWHRLSGRIIYGLLLCHAAWYLNFFVLAGLLQKRLADPVVMIGILGIIMLTILSSTSLEAVRRWSYRVFFVTHLIIGVTLMPLLFFHASPLRIYVVEALVLFIFDIACRKLDTITGFATIAQIPNTTLIQVTIPVPQSKIRRFAAAPGQHVYLQIPAESTPPNTGSPSIHDLCYNPFTIASVSPADATITLVLRALNGPTTTALSALTRLSKARPPLNIEGPLGGSRHFPNLARDYDRILLVAGGVGATFALPIYASVKEQLIAEGKYPDRVSLTWSLRSTAEAAWTADYHPASSSSLRALDDENISVFLTHGPSPRDGREELLPVDGAGVGVSVEMGDLRNPSADADAEGEGEGNTKMHSGLGLAGRGRPDLRRVVDGVFRLGREERVAVLVCGPASMAREVRAHVGRWVKGRGRDVWWHDEGFGW
ncbi:uncharacterized protein L3040_003798 [Drepanopeziza brunnea f. sp. 'multigermtubi']|uniref:ferric-chelate reductase (NADPH) n=1 Tax=Marssonina brunnea f. sp. multigermtubi (strain MB_m1) TaxID=1072389 RepID=K1XQX3_MARBU|nr:uncharacterized protein MBM_06765 [Drepanopeziza brunnea f. sp. 'multigermtubi' MB_m1]EKD15004.1 hypothetical protein MBM_06765 [Drepanopeziza brunnea f. sp. 'multigermtubi' MB_m1]KAJ5046559.1 hypothetical protein L3040_003798 [Drepanopeziza brunnea f. sp. 'multigermtubi']